MDFRALWETLVAVALTPVVSVVMSLIVVGGIAYVLRRIYRR